MKILNSYLIYECILSGNQHLHRQISKAINKDPTLGTTSLAFALGLLEMQNIMNSNTLGNP